MTAELLSSSSSSESSSVFRLSSYDVFGGLSSLAVIGGATLRMVRR